MTQQPHQLSWSTSVWLCTPWTPLDFSGPRPLWASDPCWFTKKGSRGLLRGQHRSGWCAYTYVCEWWECRLASADTTQASAVSSHQLIPLPRSPHDPDVLGSLLWPGTFSMDGEGWVEAPCLPVPHHHCDIIETHTHLCTEAFKQHQWEPTHTWK